MELIYAWIEEFRSFTNVAIPLSGRFCVDYSPDSGEIRIEENKEYHHIYPEHITNVHALLGKNASGKSNLMELLASCYRDQYSSFFILYHVENKADGPVFFLEGTHPWKKTRSPAFHPNEPRFSITRIHCIMCQLQNNRLLPITSMPESTALLLFVPQSHTRRIASDDMSTALDAPVIEDPSRDAVLLVKPPVSMLVSFLNSQLKNDDRKVFREESYLLNIRYQHRRTMQYHGITSKILRPRMKTRTRTIEALNMLYSFCLFFLSGTATHWSDKTEKDADLALKRIYSPEKNTEIAWKDYYREVIYCIAFVHHRNGPSYKLHSTDSASNANDDLRYGIDNFILDAYDQMVDALDSLLSKHKLAHFENGSLLIPITKRDDTKLITAFLQATIDENTDRSSYETNFVFSDFFSFELTHLSDGEFAFLNLMAVVNKAITAKKQWDHFILLFDEPEEGLHPELSRSLISIMINFLSQYKDKKFQLIFSSHSPFIASDVLASNVVRLENTGKSCRADKNMEQTFGQNIHMLLKNSFFMTSTIGAYAEEKIHEVLGMLDEEQGMQQKELATEAKTLERQRQPEWQKKWADAAQLISLIGEDVLRNTLKKRLLSLKRDNPEKNTDILNAYHALSAEEKAAFIEALLREDDWR